MLEEKDEKIPIRFSSVDILIGKKWQEFRDNYDFFMVEHEFAGELEDKAEDTLSDASYEVYRNSPLPEEEFNEDTEDESEEDNKMSSLQSKWTADVNKSLLLLRSYDIPVSRVFKKGKQFVKHLVMLPAGYREQTKAAFESIKGCRMRYVKPIITDSIDVTRSDLVNLLSINMVYEKQKQSGNPVPLDRLIYGYCVHVSGDKFNHADDPLWENCPNKKVWNKIKNAFLVIYIKDDVIHMDIKSYYEYGEWYEKMNPGRRKDRVAREFYYDTFETVDGRHLLTCESVEINKGKMSSASPINYKNKKMLDVKSSNTKDSSRHEAVKPYYVDKMLFEFNNYYKGIIEVKPQIIDCIYDKDELMSDEKISVRFKEKYLKLINTIRENMSSYSINVFGDAKFDNNAFAEKVDRVYGTALYKGSVSTSKRVFDNIRIVPSPDSKDAITDIRVMCNTEKEENKSIIATSTTPEKEEYLFSCSDLIPKAGKNGKVTLKIEADVSRDSELEELKLSESIKVYIEADGVEHPYTPNLKYHSGFGVENRNIICTESYKEGTEYDPYLNIHIVEDLESEDYDTTVALSVQHITQGEAGEEKEKDYRTVITRIIYELYIKMCVMRNVIDENGMETEVERALWVAHIAKKKGKKAYKRFFYYDRNLEATSESCIREVSEKEARSLYKNLGDISSYGDKYAVTVNGKDYFISKTDRVVLGKSSIDENGELLPPKEIGSKGKEYYDRFAGYVGMSFYFSESDNRLYYIVGDSILRNGDFGISGDIVRFPHVYEVRSGNIFNTIDFDVEAFRKMLGTTIVRNKKYTVRPSIFKFIREWANCGGRKNP